MPSKPNPVTIADSLRAAIRDSNLSYNELARLAKADQGTISRFMLGQRDLTLAVASRLCLVLGFGLTRVGTTLTEPLAAPPKSNRKRPKNRRPPASAVKRGQGRRVDLETKEEAALDGPEPTSESGTEKIGAAPPLRTGDSAPASGVPAGGRRKRKKA